MPRAYEPGERWEAFQDMVVDAVPTSPGRHKQWTMALCRVGTWEDRCARARLIAESPERDELLREVEQVLADSPALNGLWSDLLARIRDTLGRTEQP